MIASTRNLHIVPPPEVTRAEIRIAFDFALPLDTITQSLSIVAQRGSGKTYLAKKMLEEILRNKLPVVVIDLMGAFWGIRSSTDGESEGYEIPIFGGGHGDFPLDANMGRALARWVCSGEEQPKPVILDISCMKKSEQQSFVADFGEELYDRNKRPLHVILDEADFFASQRFSQKGIEKRLFDVFDAIVRRGRIKGFGITMITQRPAVLHKDLLTQSSALVMLRLASPQDQKAVKAWIEKHDSRQEQEQVLSSLGSLPIGTAWVWSPGWLRRLRKIRVGRQKTWDSSSTPKIGETIRTPRMRSEVDVDSIEIEVKECSREVGKSQKAKRPRKK
jgi:hypothetical protein